MKNLLLQPRKICRPNFSCKLGILIENMDMLFLLLTDILSENSYVIYAGAEAENILSQGFNQMPVDGEALLEGVVSRKKQFVPVMMGMLMA